MLLTSVEENLKTIPPGRILGVDYGKSRIGLSLSDPMQIMASSLKTIVHAKSAAAVQELAELVKEKQIIAMVLGRPVHMTGETSDMATQVESFADLLSQHIDIPIFYWDERWTTVSAEKLMQEMGYSPSRQRHKIDQVAASFLLQNFLDRLASARHQHPIQ